MIKIDFERETAHGTYRDAITVPDDQIFTQEQIDDMMQQRVNNWVSYMDSPPQPEPEPEYIEIDGVKYLKAE
jgi:hypothetical protein